jgi:2-dehydropantoate 2-reductase
MWPSTPRSEDADRGETVRIAIIGAGNIGSLLGALLADSGQDVTLVELREDVVAAIAAEGIRIDMSDGRSIQTAVKITSDVNQVDVPDLVVLAVKSNATRSAIAGAKGIISDNTWVLSVQNGAGNVEAIVDVLGDSSRVIGGVFWCNVTPVALNHLSWVVGTGGLKIGPASGILSPKVDEIGNVFRGAAIDVAVSTDVQRLIWSKVLQNVPLALGTAMRLTNDEYAAYPHAKELIVKMAEECVAVTKGAGIALDPPDDPIGGLLDTIQKFHDSGRKPKCSMLQDLELGRKTEIDAINGSIVREGKRLGIPTPVNEVMVALVKVQEEKNCS